MGVPRLIRRLLSPVQLACEVALLGVMGALAIVGAAVIPFDRRGRVLRLAAMAAVYLGLELLGLARFFVIWVGSPLKGGDWADRQNRVALAWVLGRILGSARRILGFRVDVQEPPVLAPFDRDEPVLVLARHGGIGDSFTLVWLLCDRYERRPRVVVRKLLLWDPLIDVALCRMGACWIARRGSPSERQAEVAATSSRAAPGEAVLIFPEGGNWTPRRRLNAMARLWIHGQDRALRAAALMDHVLSPRPGGVLACLGARPDMPVVVMAHAGLDRITSAAELWRALPFDVPMQLRWWLPAGVPEGDEARVEWLTAEWAVVDQWISRALALDTSDVG